LHSELTAEAIHQYAITGLNFSSSFARVAKRDMSAFLNGAGSGVVIVKGDGLRSGTFC
jgi:hypothetical protein